MSKMINVEKSKMSGKKKQKPHHKFLKFTRKIQSVLFPDVWIGFSCPSHNSSF